MNTLDALAGVLRVRPGAARPQALAGSRPDWAATLGRGKPADLLPGLLSSVFSLCAHAHALCARAAVDAARGIEAPPSTASLRDETLREHLRRLLLDWPTRLAGSPSAEAQRALAACPLLRPDATDTPADWLERHLLGGRAQDWLAAWDADPHAAFASWRAGRASWLAALMDDIAPIADRRLPVASPLRVHADDAGLRALAGRLADEDDFSRLPDLDGRCAETGCWTRLDDAPKAPPAPTAGARMAARIAETVRLALPDAASRLRSGQLALGPGTGLAWAEMARGLLLHYVELDPTRTVVQRCRVLAPTEWNFHPQGAVAASLETLDPQAPDIARQVAVLMSAWDPCVRYDLLLPEVAHA